MMNNPNLFRLNDIFHTFQGEGMFAGSRALFVRLPFCNLKCTWCDTKFNSYFESTEEEFENFIKKEPCRFAVITGGEPMMNQQTPKIIAFLKKHGFMIACETNGTFPIVDGIDFVTCSPKKFSEQFKVTKKSVSDPQEYHPPYYVDPQAFDKVHEFKYVVDADFDFSILERHHVEGKFHRLSLSPEFGNMKESIEKITAFIQKHPHWKLNLQTHKFIGIP